jgi:hypothetical protein
MDADDALVSLDTLRDDITRIVQQHETVGSVQTTPRGKRGACTMEVFGHDGQQIAVVTIGADGTVDALPVVLAEVVADEPTHAGRTLAEWDAYIGSAPNMTASGDRMQEAAFAGVDFNAMFALQTKRHAS